MSFCNNAKKEIIEKMIATMDSKVSVYKDEISKSNYTIHQLITLASIVELEGSRSNDRKGVAGVFYNRLNAGMSLGSDVTTYYAAKVEMNERDLYKAEIDSVNAYNTRSASMAGKLPVGPICNPGIESIEAALKPKKSDYYYFVADKNGKVYFDKEELDSEEQYEEDWQINPEHQGAAVLILPYFNKNIIQNFNVDYPEKFYLPHHYRTPDEQAEIKRKWKEKGLPDILVGNARLESVFDGMETKYNYFQIKTIYFDSVWKNKAPRGSITVYAHKNIYNDMPSEGKITPKIEQSEVKFRQFQAHDFFA